MASTTVGSVWCRSVSPFLFTTYGPSRNAPIARAALLDVRAVVLHFSQQRDQLRARRRRAGHLGGQRAVLTDAGEKKLRHLLLVLQERLLLALGDLEEGRLRDVNEALVDQSGHVPEEKRQQQRAYVT